MDFHRFRGPRLPTNKNVCRRDDALKESFTRFQLAAIIDSSIHGFIGPGGWAGWLAGWLAGLGWAAWLAGLGWPGWLAGLAELTGQAGWLGWLACWLAADCWLAGFLKTYEISWISIDFEVRGYRLIKTFAAEMMPLEKALLDSGWLLSSIPRFIDSSDLAPGLAGWLDWAGLAWLAGWAGCAGWAGWLAAWADWAAWLAGLLAGCWLLIG